MAQAIICDQDKKTNFCEVCTVAVPSNSFQKDRPKLGLY